MYQPTRRPTAGTNGTSPASSASELATRRPFCETGKNVNRHWSVNDHQTTCHMRHTSRARAGQVSAAGEAAGTKSRLVSPLASRRITRAADATTRHETRCARDRPCARVTGDNTRKLVSAYPDPRPPWAASRPVAVVSLSTLPDSPTHTKERSERRRQSRDTHVKAIFGFTHVQSTYESE